MLSNQSIKHNAMKTAEEIIAMIEVKEKKLYEEYSEMLKHYGPDDRGTRYAAAQWNAVQTILEKIEDEA